jgi:hypothetical protein
VDKWCDASPASGSCGGTRRPDETAGILLDNWLKGRRRAVWVSKSDKLIEDAQRDWSALGQERLLVTPLARFAQGTAIRLAEGILSRVINADHRAGPRISRRQGGGGSLARWRSRSPKAQFELGGFGRESGSRH